MPKKTAATYSKADLTWAYPLLERGVALSSDGEQLAQFERTDLPDHAWRCTRAYDLIHPYEAFDLLALWLYDGCLSWVARLVDSPEAADVPQYLVHVNNRGVHKQARPQLRYVRWIPLESYTAYADLDSVFLEAATAQLVGWTAIRENPPA